MNADELRANAKEMANVKDILKDTLQCDPKALETLDMKDLDLSAIKIALDFLMNDNDLTQQERSDLLNESWRVNFKAKPPTPQEFMTEAYLGPAALHTYDRVKKIFYEFMNPDTDYRHLILFPHIGFGKSLLKNSKILTPKSYILLENIKIGDEVCTPDGKTSHVTALAEFPDEPVYKIKFGDSREVYACGNHNWKVAFGFNNKIWNKELQKNVCVKKANPSWKIKTTKEIYEDIQQNGKKHRWFIPVTKPIDHEEKPHIIPPYTLGAFLGDGSLNQKDISIVNDDFKIMERVMKELDSKDIKYTFDDFTDENGNKKEGHSVKYQIRVLKGKFQEELTRLGLMDTNSYTKFIPDEYLYDSLENRIALMQGLMDTDGSVERKSYKGNFHYAINFFSSSENLIRDVRTLFSGLGASKVTLHERYRDRPERQSNISHEMRLDITFPEAYFPIFHLDRKQRFVTEEYSKEKTGYKQKTKPQVLHIESIEPTDMKGGICIETDDDERLFLVDDYIVTHNSYLSAVTTLYISTHVALMRNPWKFFGLNPATVLCQMLCSYSLKKSSELLLEPFFNLLESSPFFEKVRTREAMIKKDDEFRNLNTVNKVYYTTAAKTSDIAFSGGCNIKCVSRVQGLLGATIISIALSELAFFTDAGMALALDEEVQMADGTKKAMKDIKIGDRLYSPTAGTTVVTDIPWEDEGDLYEIRLDDGRTVKCHANHLWPVTCKYGDESYDTVVRTRYMIEHPEIEFNIIATDRVS